MKWSYSDSNCFFQCRRLYYLSSVLANSISKDTLRRRAYFVKNSMNFDMWAGHIVDKFISKILIPAINDGLEINFDEYAALAVEIGKKQFDFSANKLYESSNKTEGDIEYCVLDIHELNKPYDESEIGKVYEKVRLAILNFPKIMMFNTNVSLYQHLCNNKDWLMPDITNTGFAIDSINVFPQIDLRVSGATFIDWKVSQSQISDYSRQLSIIGLVVYENRKKRNQTGENPRKLDYDHISLFEVNLIKGTIKQHTFNENIANNVYDHIFLNSRDISLIRQKDDKPSYVTMIKYEQTEGHGCSLCKFYDLCTHLTNSKHNYDEAAYFKSLTDEFANTLHD